MDAKCPKCEQTEFSIKKREDKAYCYVICKACGSVVGVLEDIDFKKHNNNVINNHNHVIKNHGFFEKRINDLEEQIKEINDKNIEIFNMVEWITGKLSR